MEVLVKPSEELELDSDFCDRRCVDCHWSEFPDSDHSSDLYKIARGVSGVDVGICTLGVTDLKYFLITSDDTPKSVGCDLFFDDDAVEGD